MSADTDDVYLNLQEDTVNRNECIYCSVSSYSIASHGNTDLQVSQCNYATCQNCSSKFCTSCIQELIQSVEGFKNIPTKVKQADKTYRQLMEIQTQVGLGSRSPISRPCCSFIAQDVSSTLVKTPRPHLTSQCSRIESIKNYRASIQKIKPDKLQAPPLDNLHLQQYFGNPKVTSYLGLFKPKEHPKQLHTRITKKRKKHYTSINSTYNPFSGALVLPTYGIIIEGEVSNSHWYCDHHALARLTVDGTLGVPHCVLSNDCAELLHSSNLCLPCVTGSREVFKLVICAPEDINQKRDITVEVIEIEQTTATSVIMNMKGDNCFDIEFMKSMSFFSSEDMRQDVDVTIILGKFTIDSSVHPKMLLLRFSGMQANVHYSAQRRNEISKELYHRLLPIAGL